jgi:iron complex outermembrane receptor protein
MTYSKLTLWSSTAVMAVMAATPAYAQANPQPKDSGGLEEIIVTARRTNENLQRVPVATSVLSGATLERQRISSTRDLQYSVPSLIVAVDPLGGQSTPIVELRGQTAPLSTDNTVVSYFADVPVDARVVAAGVYDLNSIQVIRGPQGTLFGKNSTGGAIVYTPQKATADKIKGFGQVTIGNYGLHEFTGAVNLPLIKDVLAVRVSGQTTDQNGFAKNLAGPDGNDKHWQAGRAVINLTPGGNFENQTVFTYFKGKNHLNPSILQSISGVGFFFPAVIQGLALQKQLGPRTFSMSEANGGNIDNNRSYLISNVSTYNLGGATLKNIFGYSNTHLFTRMNQPAIEFNYIDVQQARSIHQYSDELQLSGNSFDNSLKWIVGGYWSKSKNVVFQTIRVFTPVPYSSDGTEEYESKAVFGQGTYDFTNLGLSGVKFTAGIRQTWDKRTGSNAQVFPIPTSTKNKHTSWTLGLDYQVSPDILLYVASRRSYKAGGFNLVSPNIPASSLLYQPETLTDIELGMKAKVDIGSVPVRANLALYRGWYKKIQTQATGFCGTALSQTSLIINAGSGSPKGLELELDARLTPNLHVTGFYNRTLGKYKSFVIPNVPGCTIGSLPDLSGVTFGNIAKNAAGLTATYTMPLKNDQGELELTGNMYARSARLGNALNSYNSPTPGYALFNARLDYNHIGGSAFSLGAYVRNIGNRLYVTAHNFSPAAGFDIFQFGDPRTVGVVGKIDF